MCAIACAASTFACPCSHSQLALPKRGPVPRARGRAWGSASALSLRPCSLAAHADLVGCLLLRASCWALVVRRFSTFCCSTPSFGESGGARGAGQSRIASDLVVPSGSRAAPDRSDGRHMWNDDVRRCGFPLAAYDGLPRASQRRTRPWSWQAFRVGPVRGFVELPPPSSMWTSS